jgi:hypothetical protein
MVLFILVHKRQFLTPSSWRPLLQAAPRPVACPGVERLQASLVRLFLSRVSGPRARKLRRSQTHFRSWFPVSRVLCLRFQLLALDLCHLRHMRPQASSLWVRAGCLCYRPHAWEESIPAACVLVNCCLTPWHWLQGLGRKGLGQTTCLRNSQGMVWHRSARVHRAKLLLHSVARHYHKLCQLDSPSHLGLVATLLRSFFVPSARCVAESGCCCR